jgi:uncharacterized RDD family membrane protein YckC
VTPHAFQVDEALLNTPLAAPWQRLVALLIDLLIAGLIANVAGALVGFFVAYVFYRLATGLLGFVQLYWDPNRQAIHDRVARTVVVRSRRFSPLRDVGGGRSAEDLERGPQA